MFSVKKYTRKIYLHLYISKNKFLDGQVVSEKYEFSQDLGLLYLCFWIWIQRRKIHRKHVSALIC